jgi:hypothetical protein
LIIIPLLDTRFCPVAVPLLHLRLPSFAMFGPFPPCLVDEPSSPKSPGKSPGKPPGRMDVRHSFDIPVETPVTEVHHTAPPQPFVPPVPAPDPGPPCITAGNAFSMIARREWEESRLPRKSMGEY